MDIKKILNYYNLELDINNKILCPFHLEGQPSLEIDLIMENFHCFGCGVSGDIIGLVAKLEKINRLKALLKITKISGKDNKKLITLGKIKGNWIQEAYEEYIYYDTPDWEMPNYLTKRGFSPETLSFFGIKFNPLSDYSIIIPLFENGKFKGYAKRTTDNRTNKYLFNYGFKRQKVLVGEYKKGEIFVTEGILDYIKASQFGVKNIVCLQGWKASKNHIKKLKKYTNKIISALDNDIRGKEGTEYLRKFFKVTEFIFPKGVKDICEMKEKQFKEKFMEVKNEKRKNFS